MPLEVVAARVRLLGHAVAEHDLARARAVDVAHDPLVEAVAEQLEQAVGERRRDLGRDAEVRVLLLAHEARAVLHVHAEPAVVGGDVRAARVPQAPVEHHHRAGGHLERAHLDVDRRVGRLGRVREAVRAGHETRAAVVGA